jgi:transcriptional regulator with XRE-family HTH domain
MGIGKAIKLIRTASGLKQKEVAKKLGVTSNYLSLIESGRREPSVSLLKRLATVLHVPIAVFFLWERETASQPTKELGQARDLLAQLEAMYVFASRGKRKGRAA